MHVIMNRDETSFIRTETLKRSKIGNTSSALMHRHSALVKTVKAQMNNAGDAGAFQFKDGISIVNMRMKVIVDDPLSL